jgi:hypothetical protein
MSGTVNLQFSSVVNARLSMPPFPAADPCGKSFPYRLT